jgi:hypothetical protein
MELASSEVAVEKLDGIATYVSLLHGADGLVTYRVENPAVLPAAELYQLREKLLNADEGKDIYLYGRVSSNVFTAYGIREGGYWLSDDDFTMFCEAMDVPYIE